MVGVSGSIAPDSCQHGRRRRDGGQLARNVPLLASSSFPPTARRPTDRALVSESPLAVVDGPGYAGTTPAAADGLAWHGLLTGPILLDEVLSSSPHRARRARALPLTRAAGRAAGEKRPPPSSRGGVSLVESGGGGGRRLPPPPPPPVSLGSGPGGKRGPGCGDGKGDGEGGRCAAGGDIELFSALKHTLDAHTHTLT